MISFLLSKLGIIVLLSMIVGVIFIYQYLKWKWQRKVKKETIQQIDIQEMKEERNETTEVDKRAAKRSFESSDDVDSWLRKHSRRQS
ncbi:MAG: hypothetical protein FK731_06300 [Asgard group archaeon]|nr:hypothetical protein [Asgard group archaeon]